MSLRRPSSVAAVFLLALAYFAAGRLGMMLPGFGTIVTLLWLPAGIAVAALLRWGFVCWPGVMLGAFAVGIATAPSVPAALGIALGNTLGPLLTAWTLRSIGFHAAFDRKRDIVLLALAAAVGMLPSATFGIGSLSLAGSLPEGLGAAGLIWWAGDIMGVLLTAPLVLAFTQREVRGIALRRGEFALWLATTALVTWGVFVWNNRAVDPAWSVAFLPLPLVAWAALRYGPVGTSLALIVISVGATYGTATGHGPLVRPRPIEDVEILWIFMATAAALGWLITALDAARVSATGIQQLFERALTDVSLGVIMAGPDRRITYANQGFTRLTGYLQSELLGRNCSLLQGPDTDPGVLETLKAAVHGDGFFDGELLNYRKDGTTFWNALLISPVRDELGQMTGFLAIQRDITSRRIAEDALLQSEEHLRTIVELEPECVKLLSPDGSLLEMNPAGLAMIEATSLDQVRGHHMAELIVPENRAAFADMHQRVMRGETGRCEFAITGLRGTRRWLETHAVPYRDARRQIIGALGITRDITQRKESAAELERTFSTLQLFINSVPAYISFVDADERYRLINRGYEEYFGLPADQIVGKRVRDVRPPAAWAEMEPHVRAALAGDPVRYQSNAASPDGTSRWLDVQYTPRRGIDGAVSGFFVLVFDITENKRAEFALRESEERYRTLARFVPVGIFRTDAEGNCVYANDRWCEMAGMPVAQALGMGWLDAVHPDDRERVLDGWHKAREAGEEMQGEYRFQAPSGKVTWLYGVAVALRNHEGRIAGFLGTITDLTERKLAEEESRKLEIHLQHAQKLESLGVLAGGIAHDFNNILTSVLGNASIAAVELPTGSPVQECIAEITEASMRAADLCKQMLAYSGRGRFVVQTLDLGQLVEQTSRMLKISISKKAVLRFRLEPALPPIEIDATQIRQVIMNLVINASEAIGDTSGVISVTTGLARIDRDYLAGTVMESSVPDGEYVFLEISDNGCGMSPETQAKIFDPFFTTKFTGRGLGLAAVLGIVRGHKGAMKVYSEVGRGTTFKLLFPIAGGASERPAGMANALPTWQGKGTVLVVDDEETLRSTVARMMRLYGLEPVLVADGREAVSVFRENPDRFAFVLLDLTMPHMDGEQTFTELRRLRPDVRVALMSGFDAREAMLRFAGKGLAGFLQKPFTVIALRALLQEVLG